MARTTPSDVVETFDTDVSNSAVSDWIDHASDIVDRVSNNGTSLSSGELERLEKLVAQAYLSAQDPRIQSAGSASRNVSYDRTSYWKIAQDKDDTGTLARISQGDIVVVSTTDL